MLERNICFFLKDNYLFLFLSLLFIFLVCSFYPGMVTYDTYEPIYKAAVTNNNIGDWHSPMMVRAWQVILFFTDIRGVFFLIQLTLMISGFYLIGKNISKGIITGLICVVLVLIPPVFSFIPTVSRDVSLAVFIFFIASIFINNSFSDKGNNCLIIVLCLILLFYCFYVRANGSFISIPFLVGILIGWKSPIIYRYLLCLIIVILTMMSLQFMNHRVLKAVDLAPDFSLMIFDLAGVSHYSDKLVFPSNDVIPDDISVLHRCYIPDQWDVFSAERPNGCGLFARYYFNKIAEKGVKKARKELRKQWVSAIIHHPFAYLQHRLIYFDHFLHFSGHLDANGVYWYKDIGFLDPFDKNDQEGKVDSKVWNYYVGLSDKLSKQIWFLPYFWVLILFFFYLSTLFSNDKFNRTLNLISFSGLVYILGYFVVGVSGEYRYCYPSVLLSISCILGAFSFYCKTGNVFGSRKARNFSGMITIILFSCGIII